MRSALLSGQDKRGPKGQVSVSAAEEAAVENADDKAEAEARQIASGKTVEQLEAEDAERERKRTQRFKDHFEILAIGAMWAFAFTLLAIGLTWLWHLLTPTTWHWLTDDALTRLQNVFTGGILASVFAEHFRKRLT